eukprot:1144177-Pelagomonas_calceolata.AAC.1
MPSNSTCIRITDLDTPTSKQATIRNASRNMPCISSPMKRTILQYRTGTLYNQKRAVRFKVH